MSTRLALGGRLIDRSRQVSFTFDGKTLRGLEGDTLASALLANGQMIMGRSFKYHRPRGVVASGPEEPNALVNLGEGGRFEPNTRATTQEIFDGLTAESQNRWPSLEYDIGVVNSLFSCFLPAGFYYKMFIHPRPLWKHLFEPAIRHSAGLGRAPKARDDDRYEHFHAHVDVLIAGGGVAGIAAALEAGRSGKRVLLVEQSGHWGGRAVVDGAMIDGKSAEDWVRDAIHTLEGMENVTLRTRAVADGVYDHGLVMVHEHLTDHLAAKDSLRQRLWRVRAGKLIVATGAIERPLSFAGNDIPGVMLAGAVRDYLINHAISPGDRTVLVTNNDDAYRTALALTDAGLIVPAVLDARPVADGPLVEKARAAGIRVETGRAITRVRGRGKVTAVEVGLHVGEGSVLETIPCDAVAMSGGWSPVVHLWSHCGGKLNWDDEQAHFRPDPARPPLGADGAGNVTCVGAANGHLRIAEGLGDAVKGAAAAAGSAAGTVPEGEDLDEAPLMPVWLMPEGAGVKLRSKMWLDYQNDVKVSDVQLAAREGYESVEHTKRYTTLGMATDQGKLSNINGLAVLSSALNAPIPQVGTTTFRPPYVPRTIGAIAGSAQGETFMPLRRTQMDAWHEAQGAEFEPVALWRRPYTYLALDETRKDAVNREILNTRRNVGILDASTLGKIIVKGPDAGRFVDMMYTNMMSNLAVGRCRYGLMCNEQGFLIDDGVVARLSEDTWLCHTTSGGADTVHAHMEDWLQCEWWDWQVYTANVTEQWGQIGVVGPNARKVLEKLGGMDVSKEALPFMNWVDGTLAGFPVRVFRISFSGELSYEIAIPAGQARALWDAVLEAGASHGIQPYGTEALHVMRAEKGFIMIGDETDGTVIPQDLGLNWAISKKKSDFMGKRGQMRAHMVDPLRWRLVGLETEDGTVLPEGAYALAPGMNANGQRNVQGRVTSTYFSPTLGRGIAMGLVERGPERMGDMLEFGAGEDPVRAKIVDPVFYDKAGEKQDG